MNREEQRELLAMHDELLGRWGVDARTVLWNSAAQQERRFAQLLAIGDVEPTDSVLDIGCGVGHLYDFLGRTGWRGSYVGIDLHESMLDAARARWRGASFQVHDIAAQPFGRPSDWGVISGVLNYRMSNAWSFLASVVDHAFASVEKGLLFNFISDESRPHRAQMSYYAVGQVVDHCVRRLSHRLVVWTEPDDFNVSVCLVRSVSPALGGAGPAH